MALFIGTFLSKPARATSARRLPGRKDDFPKSPYHLTRAQAMFSDIYIYIYSLRWFDASSSSFFFVRCFVCPPLSPLLWKAVAHTQHRRETGGQFGAAKEAAKLKSNKSEYLSTGSRDTTTLPSILPP